MNNRFFFKKFSLNDYECGMPVSTDGILLGAWADGKNTDSILDIGTGTGLLALMMAQRFLSSQIVAIDIDDQAIFAAKQNVSQSLWANRITVLQADIQTWQNNKKFNLIICNPPFFNGGEKSQNIRRATARHTDTLQHNILIKLTKKLLSLNGSAHFILPIFEAKNFILQARKQELYCLRLTKVQTTQSKEPSRYLFTLQHQACELDEQSLVIHRDGKYSQEFIELTKDFYLKM